MTVKAKAIITAFYGKPPQFSYWNGCSTGGKQALTEAQRYPKDYNGIIAGAPANYMIHLHARQVAIWQYAHRTPDAMIPAAKYPMIHAAVMNECDALDGLKDGLIENPRALPLRSENDRVQGRRRAVVPDRGAGAKRLARSTRPRESAHQARSFSPVWSRAASLAGDCRRRQGAALLPRTRLSTSSSRMRTGIRPSSIWIGRCVCG